MTKLDKIYEAFRTVMECSLFLALEMVPWFLLAFVVLDGGRMVKTIECPYCNRSHAEKVWFADEYRWTDIVATDPNNTDCLSNVYVCLSCGRVALLGAEVTPHADRRD